MKKPWPSFTQEEADAVSAVLLSNKVNYWTGTEVKKFETEFAHWAETKYAIAVANGTLALDLAFFGLGIKEGDEVVVTSRTFLASVSSIVLAGATPVFADVCADSQNITETSINAVLTENTRAIVCVHLAGWPCDMDPILDLAKKHNLYVIEDCAQAHGATYKGKSVGGLGDVAAWSFCQDKIMTTGGEGGIVTTNNEQLWKKMWAYKDHGKDYDLVHHTEHPPGFRWLHTSFGTNFRMTEMQATIGRIQLKRMPHWQETRLNHAKKIWQELSQFEGIRIPVIPAFIQHAAYKCYVFVRPEYLNTGWSRDLIIDTILAQGLTCFGGSCSEVYLEKAFDGKHFKPKNRLPGAKMLGETSLMFLVHPTLTTQDIDDACEVIKFALQKALKS